MKGLVTAGKIPLQQRNFIVPSEINIIVFACGQGDTILLSLYGKWVLVDCNLPEGEVRDHFFARVRELGIERLEALCLTHPHQDHYLGMESVVEYFTTDGRSIGTFCDTGLHPTQIIAILERVRFVTPARVQEYARLYQRLSPFLRAGTIRDFPGNDTTKPLPGFAENVRLVPVGPSAARLRENAVAAVEAGRVTSRLRDQLNRLSLVLALEVRSGDKAFDALLAADTDGTGFNRACEVLREGRGNKATSEFDLVKVAHHGSHDSHHDSLVCQQGKSGMKVAVISCDGQNKVLPDRVVMQQFLDAGWRVMPTSRRVRVGLTPQRGDSPLTLSGKRPPTTTMVGRTGVERVLMTDIDISWSSETGMNIRPDNWIVTEEELGNYGTAAHAHNTDVVSVS